MKRKFLLIPLFALLLVGCNFSFPSLSEQSNSQTTNSTPSSEPGKSSVTGQSSDGVPSSDSGPSSEENFGEKDSYYKVRKGENFDNRALEEAGGLTALNSLGNQKILVVPVVFKNAYTQATVANRRVLQDVFFGESAVTGWESVASFYEKSSFGRLHLTGEVQDYYYADYTTNEFSNLALSDQQIFGDPNNFWDQTHYLIRDIYDSYPASLLRDYDQDGDGYVDALWMVYMNSYNVDDENSPFWAYKFQYNQEPNINKPTPNTYAWASFDFADEGYGYSLVNNKYDAHTFIHETGHMFGLEDYYDYEGEASPTGQIDMMDNNVIDHNVYSKYLLNWVEPYFVTGDADINLRPAESSGDFILIKDDWNGHAYDNYLLLEYYTPTGLNEKDSIGGGYGPNSLSRLKGFTEAGVRIWHVDSRLIRITYAGENSDYYSYDWVDEIEEQTNLSFTTLGPTNSGRYSDRREITEDYLQIQLLDAAQRSGKNNWLKAQMAADNKALFKKGQLINNADWGNYFKATGQYGHSSARFNDNSAVGYSVEIGTMNESGVNIKIRNAK